MPNSCPAPLERIYGVLGYPLTQSLSPVLHTWAMAQRGIPAGYTAWETPPENLAAFMRAMRETPYDGASVTIPHKITVMGFLDGLTPTAQSIGAVNTLYWENRRLMGHNTDMEGFLAPLASFPVPESVLVLGAGGAARAVLAALASIGVPHLAVSARTPCKVEALLAAFAPFFGSVRAVPWKDREIFAQDESGTARWVINATPLGMRGKAEGQSPLGAEFFARASSPGTCIAYDLVYNPLRTPFLALAQDAGWPCRDGLDMFVAQAAAQFRLWTGREMPQAGARTFLSGYLGA